ncbi:glutaredoxin family protein [Amycolatopsis aidingensis]|uniref:glutaredoxin family protein n=1 Tax=Amycolatopsis aidingensis TaxID=2842453 RepID=UPI001C0D78AA|nr:glutaredoxin family protein [Amycolatopsis aidingensis]
MTGPENSTDSTDVTLLTQPDCAFCDHAEQVLRRVGRDHPLRITEVDLGSERGRDLARRAGVMFAPGVLIEGRPFSYGRLSERKLRRTLEKRRRLARHATEPGGTDGDVDAGR